MKRVRLSPVAAHPLTFDCHRGWRGPYTGTGSLVRAIFPDLEPDVIARHAIEIAAVAPELRSLLDLPLGLTGPRWHSRSHTRHIAHGIVSLLHAHPAEVAFTGVDHADATDLEFLRLAARRGLCVKTVGRSTRVFETGEPSYHDSRAEALAAEEFSLRLGAVLYHRRHGSSLSAAIAAYHEAIEHCMGEGFYEAGLALVDELAELADTIGDPGAARTELDAVVDKDPFFAEYRADRAKVLQRLGKSALALADYEVAMRLSPPVPEHYYQRANLRRAMGETGGAIADLRYVLELEPEYLEARLVLATLLPAEAAVRLLRDGPGDEPRLQVALMAQYRSALDGPWADRDSLLDGLADCEAALGWGERTCK